jgi:hypothetical protein
MIKNLEEEGFFTYSVVSLCVGIEERFVMYDGTRCVTLDEISTVRKRLSVSLANTVPFFMYGTQKKPPESMLRELKKIVEEIFET